MRLRRLLRWRLAGWLAVAALPLAVWAFWLEPASLVVREARLDLPAWPPECDGLRVALLADLHVGSPFNGRAKLDEIVRRTQAARPDLILLGGDYVIQGVPGGRFVSPEETAAALGRLKAPLGVWAVLGNHDWWLDAPRVRTALETAGIPVLDDQSRELTRGACRFWLAGISDLWEGKHEVPGTLAGVPPGGPLLVFTHNPDIFVDIPPRVTLTLAGHTHGGQVWLPILGRPIVPSRYKQRFAIGHIVEQGRHLFVSPGLGTSILPVRFLVPPEISVVRLGSQSGH